MAYRRKIIDRRTREGKSLGNLVDALKGFGILALIVGYLVSGSGHPDKPSGDGKDALVPQAQATPLASPMGTRMPTPIPQQPNSFVPFAPPAPAIPAGASTSLAMNSLPSQASAPGTDNGSARQVIPWRHVTASGVRWSLRHAGATSMLLVVDLGGDQVANVSVAPAFEDLDLAGMNGRVDHLRSVIGQHFPLQTANYGFDRDGGVRQLP